MPPLLVGTTGDGLWRSEDGTTWAREPGVPDDAAIFSLARGTTTVYAGGRGAVHRSDGTRWRAAALPEPGLEVWSLAVDADDPATVYAGCRPLALLVSGNGGERWSRVDLKLPPGTAEPHTPRITAIVAEGTTLWCGVEVGGVFASRDGGASWEPVNEGLPSPDIHGLARGAALVTTTPRGIARLESPPGGDGLAAARWEQSDLVSRDRYCRALVSLPARRALLCGLGDGPLLCGLGDGPPGSRGAVVRSEDDGRTWQPTRLSEPAPSTIWSLAADGDLALAAAFRGAAYLSRDAGRSWTRLARTFNETRAVLVA